MISKTLGAGKKSAGGGGTTTTTTTTTPSAAAADQQGLAGSEKAIKIERQSLLYSAILILNVLTGWTGWAVHFFLLSFGISDDWPPLFFALITLNVVTCYVMTPIITVFFDTALKRVVFDYLGSVFKLSRGSTVSPNYSVKSITGGRRSVVEGVSQMHFGSRVSHVEIDNQGAVSAMPSRLRGAVLADDSDSRRDIIRRLFGDKEETYEFSDREEANLALAKSFLNDLKKSKFTPLQQSNDLVKVEIASKPDDASSSSAHLTVVLESTVTVRASVEEVAAFIHDFDSHYYTTAAQNDRMVRDRYLLPNNNYTDVFSEEEDSGGSKRSYISYCRIRMPRSRTSRRDRTFCVLSTCGKMQKEGSVTYISSSTKHDLVPETDEHVRASSILFYNIQKSAEAAGKTVVKLSSEFDFRLPPESMKQQLELLATPLSVRAVSQVQRYFQNLRPLSDLDEDDGHALGVMLVDSALAFQVKGRPINKKQMARLAVDLMLRKCLAIRDVHLKYEFFSSMLVKIMRSLPLPPDKVTKPLDGLSAADGERIGERLAFMLATNSDSKVGVDEWFKAHPALVEFERRHKFFRSFVYAIAKRKLRSSDWSATGKLVFGAALSTFDTISDVLMIIKYTAEGRTGFAKVLLASIATTLALQLFIVYIQTRKKPSAMVKEVAITVLLLKPAVDAWRVAVGKEEEDYHTFDPKVENMISKIIELFGESLPGAVIQMYALVTATEKPNTVSLVPSRRPFSRPRSSR